MGKKSFEGQENKEALKKLLKQLRQKSSET